MLGLAAFVVSGACLPHLHASGEFGLWNEEHDLSLMAALGTAASQLDATPVVGLVLALVLTLALAGARAVSADRKSTRLNSSHGYISYAVFCLKKKKKNTVNRIEI